MNTARVSAAARQERLDRLRRDRAAAQVLQVAYPSVQYLRLELKFESATSNPPTLQAHELHPPARAFFEFPCPYADCDGQFDLTTAVKAAVADPTHQTAGVLECPGQRVHNLASKQPCKLQLHYHITAAF